MKPLRKETRPSRLALRAAMLCIAVGAWVFAGTQPAHAASQLGLALSAYDAAIQADSTATLAKLTNAVSLDGKAGVPFDFGATSGDTTREWCGG